MLAVALGAAALGAGAFAASVVLRAASDMPSLSAPLNRLSRTSVIYDRQGHAVTAVPGGQLRQVVPLERIPLTVQHAFIAVEDRRFYQNQGFDLRSILRAAWADLRGRPLQGGSTITQQLAKNLYLTPRDTLTRKVKEAWLAIELERRYTKAEILDRYLNWIYLGQNAYGVQAAAETYFGVPVGRVTLPQAALLAGLTQAPSAYDPLLHPRAARARRDTVLALMRQQGYISAAQERAAAAAPLGLAARRPGASPSYPDPWFVDAVLEQLESRDHLSPQEVAGGGLRIYTTLDPRIQAAAERAVADLARHGGAFAPAARPAIEAAEAVIDPSDGDVVAIVGGRRHDAMMAFDRALQAERQPGSAIKPLVDYIPALMHGLTAGTVVDDALRTYASGAGPYTPTNYDHLYYGLTTLTEALRRSVNVVAVKVLHRIGVQTGLRNAVAMGLPLTRRDAHLSLALGGTADCCTPLDMARAYAAIANGGYRVHPRLITRVVAPNGRVLVSDPVRLRRVIPANVAYVMTKMLEAVDEPQPNAGWNVLSGPLDSNWGTGYDASVHDNVPGWPTAAKTGTTNSDEDAWYVGFTPRYAAAVWIGYDHPRPFPGLFGGEYAGPIFRSTMEAALAGQKPVHFPRPQGVVTAPIDIKAAPWTVALPGPLTPPQDVRREWFVAGTQPTAPSTLWARRQVTGSKPPLLWQPACGGTPETRVFLDRRPYGARWAKKMAARIGTADWRSLIPIDMSLAPPTRSCASSPGTGGGPGAGPTPTAPGGGTPLPGCQPAAGGEVCAVVLTQGQPPAPSAIPGTVGQPLVLDATARTGSHLLLIPAFGIQRTIGQGQAAEVVLTPARPGIFPVLDVTSAGTERASLIVAPAASSPGTGPAATSPPQAPPGGAAPSPPQGGPSAQPQAAPGAAPYPDAGATPATP